MANSYQVFRAKVIERMEHLKVSKAQVSRKAGKGITWVNDLLQENRHTRGMSTTDLDLIADVLGVPPHVLIDPDARTDAKAPKWCSPN